MSSFSGFRIRFPVSTLCTKVTGDEGEPALEFLTMQDDEGKPAFPLFTFQAAMVLFAAMRGRIEPTIMEIPDERVLLRFLNGRQSEGVERVVFDPSTRRHRAGTIDDLIQLVQDSLDAAQ